MALLLETSLISITIPGPVDITLAGADIAGDTSAVVADTSTEALVVVEIEVPSENGRHTAMTNLTLQTAAAGPVWYDLERLIEAPVPPTPLSPPTFPSGKFEILEAEPGEAVREAYRITNFGRLIRLGYTMHEDLLREADGFTLIPEIDGVEREHATLKITLIQK